MTITTDIASNQVETVAAQIREDIRRRGLVAGDQYLTAEEASRLLSVSRPIANRALKLLSQKGVIIRHRRRGSFISNVGGSRRKVIMQNIYLLLPSDQVETSGSLIGNFVPAIRREMETVNVQVTFLPARNRLEYVKALIDTAKQAHQLGGVIGVSCGQDVYEFLSRERIPTVICGSYHGTGPTTPTIDVDCRQAARLLMQFLVDHGHRRIAILAENHGRPGDHDFHDEAVDVLTEAGLPPNALLVRSFPGDYDAYRRQVTKLLELENPPTGIICRGEMLAIVAHEVASELGLKVPGDIELVFEDFAGVHHVQPKYPHVQPKMLLEEFATNVARILCQLRKGQKVDRDHLVVPVKMCGATNGAA